MYVLLVSSFVSILTEYFSIISSRMNDKIRPPNRIICPPEHHASMGIRKPYPKEERERIVFLHDNFPAELVHLVFKQHRLLAFMLLMSQSMLGSDGVRYLATCARSKEQ